MPKKFPRIEKLIKESFDPNLEKLENLYNIFAMIQANLENSLKDLEGFEYPDKYDNVWEMLEIITDKLTDIFNEIPDIYQKYNY